MTKTERGMNMSKKEEKKKRKEAEKAIREYKQWELQQRQFLEDCQVMEDYLDALSKSLKGNKKAEKETQEETGEAGKNE